MVIFESDEPKAFVKMNGHPVLIVHFQFNRTGPFPGMFQGFQGEGFSQSLSLVGRPDGEMVQV